ncbi:MAG: TlyA family RNA methyltransferase [Cellulomonadaceae bacterium]
MTQGRLDATLVMRGLARSRRQAGDLVREGRVRVSGTAVTKPSALVDAVADVVVAADPDDPGYASRAAHKLAGALDAFAVAGRAVPVEGRTCLDLGASTGGFTDVLLRRGARAVLAIDVGHGQLRPRLREDERVRVREGLNVRDLKAGDLPWPVQLVVGDLSFISLRLVLATVAEIAPDAEHLLMVKPQFEVGRERLGRGGVVRAPALHADAVQGVLAAAAHLGLHPRGLVASALPGPSGNREFFCWLSRAAAPVAEDSARAAVRDMVASPATVPVLLGGPHDLAPHDSDTVHPGGTP